MGSTQATPTRRLGNVVLNWLAGYLTGRAIPDLTSGFRAARREHLREFLHLLPNGFSTPTTTTLAFIKAGYNVAFEPVEAELRAGHSKIRLARDGAKFFLIVLKIVTIFSPLRVFLPGQPGDVRRGCRLRRVDHRHAVAHHELVGAADHACRDRVPRRSCLRADRGPAFRGAPVAPTIRMDQSPPAVRTSHGAAARPARWMLAAVLVGLVLRLGFALGYWVGKPLTLDEQEYLLLARSLAEGRGYTYDAPDDPSATESHFAERTPAYPAFVAAALVASGTTSAARVDAGVPIAVKVAQSVLGACAVWLIGIIAWRAAGPTSGTVAAWLSAVYPPLVWISAYLPSGDRVPGARAGGGLVAWRGDRPRSRTRRLHRRWPPAWLPARPC